MSVSLGTPGLLAKSTADSSAVVSGSQDFGNPVGGVIVYVLYEGLARLTTDVQIDSVSLTRVARQLHGGGSANDDNVDIYVGGPPGSGSLSWSVTFDNTSDNVYAIVYQPINAAYTVAGAAVGGQANYTASAAFSEGVTLTATSTLVFAFGGSTAGFLPVSGVSGLTVDREEEQGPNDGGNGLLVGHFDTVTAGAHTVAFTINGAVVGTRNAVWTAVELLPAPASTISATDGTVQIGESALDPAVPPGTEDFTATGFASAINGATLDPDGAAINITSLLSNLSSTTARLTAPDISVFRVGGAWNAIQWGEVYEIEFTDGATTARVDMQFAASVPTRFGTIVTPNATHHPPGVVAGDQSYGLFTVGEGLHDPANGLTSANTFVAGVATQVPFAYDLSATAWVEGTPVNFGEVSVITVTDPDLELSDLGLPSPIAAGEASATVTPAMSGVIDEAYLL